MSICLIPAAGQATRLRPLSNNMSKAMVPVNGRPTIDYIVGDNFHIFTEFRIVVSPKNHDIQNYLSRRYPHANIKYYNQDVMNGPGGAIWAGCSVLGDSREHEPVTVWLGDTIFLGGPAYNNSAITVHTSAVPDFERWCMVSEDGTIYDKVSTRPPTNQALIGVYEFPTFKSLHDGCLKSMPADNSTREWQVSDIMIASGLKIVPRLTTEWYDCGEFHTLYESTARLMSRQTRPDNKIEVNIEECSITKSGVRIRNEALWYSEADRHLGIRPFIPSIYNMNPTAYTMEYCSGQNLQDVFAYEDLNEGVIDYIFDRVFGAYERGFSWGEESHGEKNNELFFAKTRNRLDLYKNKFNFISIDKFELCMKYIDTLENIGVPRGYNRYFVHGDYHLGNILFDFQMGKLKMIDPRGTYDLSMMYDMAKLYQSIHGEYVWIKNCIEVNQKVKKLALNSMDKHFRKLFGIEPDFVKSIVPMFLISILEFHPGQEELLFNKGLQLIQDEIA